MSIKSGVLFFSVMLLSQLACELIRVNKIKEKVLNKPLQFQGAQVFFGKNAADTKKTVFFNDPHLVCINYNESVKILPFFSSSHESEIKLMVSYDFSAYSSKRYVSNDINHLKSDKQLCFLYGHYSQTNILFKITVHVYINFLTRATTLNLKNLLILSVTKNEKLAAFEFYTREELSNGSTKQNKFYYVNYIEFGHPDISFYLNEKKFTIFNEGNMHMAFVDEKKPKSSNKLTEVGLTYLKFEPSDNISGLYYGPSELRLIV